MTAVVMQKLANVLANEGFVIKKIEDEAYGSFDKQENGEKYTGQIIITVRPVDDEEAEAEKKRLRKEKEWANAKGEKPKSEKEVEF
jgi:hypothetical protein